MNKMGTIIRREYLSRVKKKSFLILTILTPLLFVGIIAAPLLLSNIKDHKIRTIAVNDRTGLYFDRLESSDSYRFEALRADFSVLEKEKRDDYDAFLSIENCLSDSLKEGIVRFYSGRQIPLDMKSFVMEQLNGLASKDKIESYGIPELEMIVDKIHPQIKAESILWSEKGSDKKTSSEVSMVIGMTATLLIYIFIFAYGSMVMNGVIEEKSNRIVEIIVSSVKPFQLMMGKIIGIALVGLTQFVLWILLIGVFGFVFMQAADIPLELLSSSGIHPEQMASFSLDADIMDSIQIIKSFNWIQIIIWFVLYFLGGYLLYASLFAAIGAAVDNNEDTQQFVLPITFLVLFALYAGIYGAMNPEGPLLFWCSFVPFTSPIVMMVRLPFGVPVWQLIVSFGILVLTFLLCVKVAAKIYRTGILMYGKKVNYKDLWKWLRY